MSTESIPTRSTGKILAEHVNIFKRVLGEDFVPRNTSGDATDLAGSLGDTSRTWLAAYLATLNLKANGNIITLEAPGSLAAGYSLTLPEELPASSNRRRVIFGPDGAIILQDAHYSLSSASSFSPSGSSEADALTVSDFTSYGNPLEVMMIPVGTGGGVSHVAGDTTTIKFYRDGVQIFSWTQTDVFTSNSRLFPSASFRILDAVSAGTYDYKVTFQNGGSGGGITASKLLVRELL